MIGRFNSGGQGAGAALLGVWCLLVFGLTGLAGCGEAAPVDEPSEGGSGEPTTQVSFRVVDAVTGEPIDAAAFRVTYDIVAPNSAGGELQTQDVPAAMPFTLAESIAGDSLVVDVWVEATGYERSRMATFAVPRGQRLQDQRIALVPLPRELAAVEAGAVRPPPAAERAADRISDRPAERGADASPERPIPAATPRPAVREELREVRFESQPTGARVRLQLKGGAVASFDGVTPVTFKVPRGVYSWRVELDGYLTDQSQDRDLNLLTSPSETISRTLTPAGDWQAIRQRADAAFQAGRCTDAIRLYLAMTRPEQTDGDVGLAYAESRMKLAQCYQRERDFDNAIKAYIDVMALRPGQWTAKYHLGRLLCDMRDFQRGRAQLSELEGPFLGQVAAERRATVQALARYASAGCRHRELMSKDFPERYEDLRISVLSGFEEFILSSENLLRRRAVPADLAAEINTALTDARAKRGELQVQ
jgi:hypothetical protein